MQSSTRRGRAQQKRRLAELELEAIKAQINPHFIYNCLNSIQYFNMKKEFENTQYYLQLFTKLIRKTMQYSQEAFIPIGQELKYLNHYLELEKLRFKERLSFSIEVGDDVDMTSMIPAMLIQPYVENALKHGLATNSAPGRVAIRFERTETGLRILVEDDGPGIPETQRHGAMGMRLSGTRANAYNQLFELDIRVNVTNKEEGHDTKGTIIELLIPAIHDEDTKKI